MVGVRKLLRHPKGSSSIAILCVVFFVGAFAPLISPYDPHPMNAGEAKQLPGPQHMLGTDMFGRDVLSRVFHGATMTLYIAGTATAVMAGVGTSVGLLAGYFGGKFDDIVMRAVDSLMAFPSMVLILAAVAALGRDVSIIILVIGLVGSTGVIRVARGAAIQEKSKDYVTAAIATGDGSLRIALFEVFPNCFAPVLVVITLNFASAVLIEAGLSFLGLGVQPPGIEWGAMLYEAQAYITDLPLLSIFPGMAIAITSVSINLLGDALRDTLDPRLKL